MRRMIVLVVALAVVVSACGDDDTGTTTAAPPPADGGGSLVIAAVNFSANEIVLRNDGSEPYDVTGHWLCNRPVYVELEAQTLDPGATMTVPADSVGLDASDGEIGLYTSRDFDSAAAIQAYVKWGSAGGGRFDTAVEAGVWTSDEFVDNGGADIALVGDATSASGWE